MGKTKKKTTGIRKTKKRKVKQFPKNVYNPVPAQDPNITADLNDRPFTDESEDFFMDEDYYPSYEDDDDFFI